MYSGITNLLTNVKSGATGACEQRAPKPLSLSWADYGKSIGGIHWLADLSKR